MLVAQVIPMAAAFRLISPRVTLAVSQILTVAACQSNRSRVKSEALIVSGSEKEVEDSASQIGRDLLALHRLAEES